MTIQTNEPELTGQQPDLPHDAPAPQPTSAPLLCLSCGAEKRPGIDLPCGH